MLCYRLLLRNICVVDKLFAFHKTTTSGKSESNVVKENNTINKYLFGSLLETQKQRRKRLGLSKPLKFPKESASPSDSKEESISSDLQAEVLKGKKQSRKAKNQTTSHLSGTLLLESHSPGHVSCKEVEPKLEMKSDKSVSIKKKRKLKSPSGNIKRASESCLELNSSKKSADSGPSKSVTDQFIFKSVKDINDNNYPLQNSEKINLLEQNVCIENVLSFNFSDPLVKGYVSYPSVSKIMEETMTAKSKLMLSRWRQNMISDLGEEGFANYSAALKARGHDFHEAVRKKILGETVENYSNITQNALKSLDWMMELISNPLAVESVIAHPKLEYKGIPDCVAMFRKIPVVIDWKLSDKPKKDLKDTYEAPVQITAYIGALNHDPNYKWGVNHGLVAVAYTSGDPCDVFLLAPKHCEIYWRYWLQRFDKFKARSHLHIDHDIDEKSLGLS